jgi:hypothetical protein
MKQAKFISYIVLAAMTGVTALMFIASIVLTCVDMARGE